MDKKLNKKKKHLGWIVILIFNLVTGIDILVSCAFACILTMGAASSELSDISFIIDVIISELSPWVIYIAVRKNKKKREQNEKQDK